MSEEPAEETSDSTTDYEAYQEQHIGPGILPQSLFWVPTRFVVDLEQVGGPPVVTLSALGCRTPNRRA